MLKVFKFGGSILKNAEDCKLILDIVKNNQPSINIFSAFFGITDKIILAASMASQNDNEYMDVFHEIEDLHLGIARNLCVSEHCVAEICAKLSRILRSIYLVRDLSQKVLDSVVIYGELLSVSILHSYLSTNFDINLINAQSVIKTNSHFGNSKVNLGKTNELLNNTFQNHNSSYIMAGFISSDDLGNDTNLGRNGSDYTAALVASSLNAKELTIWKDVDGIFSANPKLIENALKINKVSYTEVAQMSHFGNKVLALQAVSPVIEKNINIYIKSIYCQGNPGTLISKDTNEDLNIKCISKLENVLICNLLCSNNEYKAVMPQILTFLYQQEIGLLFMHYSVSDNAIIFGVKNNRKNIEQIIRDELTDARMNFVYKYDIIAVIGTNFLNTSGIYFKILEKLQQYNISIEMVIDSLSNSNIAILIDKSLSDEAISLIHSNIF